MHLHPHARWRAAALAALALAALAAAPATAQPSPQGPGEAVSQPAPLCADALGCTYTERHPYGDLGGWRFQSLSLCGANCSTQYWVTNVATDQTALTLPPVRGGGMVAMQRPSGSQDRLPAIRTIMPDYGPSDAMCCPSNYRETTYRWDAGQGQLVADQSHLIPTANFPGWEELTQSVERDDFEIVFRG